MSALALDEALEVTARAMDAGDHRRARQLLAAHLEPQLGAMSEAQRARVEAWRGLLRPDPFALMVLTASALVLALIAALLWGG